MISRLVSSHAIWLPWAGMGNVCCRMGRRQSMQCRDEVQLHVCAAAVSRWLQVLCVIRRPERWLSCAAVRFVRVCINVGLASKVCLGKSRVMCGAWCGGVCHLLLNNSARVS
jgi:hypothetical protein